MRQKYENRIETLVDDLVVYNQVFKIKNTNYYFERLEHKKPTKSLSTHKPKRTSTSILGSAVRAGALNQSTQEQPEDTNYAARFFSQNIMENQE